MNAQDARATQRALDAAYLPPLIPVGEVYESNSALAWLLWDEAMEQLEQQHAK